MLYAILEKDKTVSTVELDINFQIDVNLGNETAESHEIDYTLASVANALVVKGPFQKSQKANITLTTSDVLSTAVDTGVTTLAAFPKDEADIQFGSTGVATTFMTAILAATGSTGSTSAVTVGANFVLQDEATGIPQNCGGATFTRTNNEVAISGVDITEITLGAASDLFYRVTGPSFGTITLTLDGIAFTTDQVGTMTTAAADLATKANANAKYTATNAAGVISVVLQTTEGYDVFINNNSSTHFAKGTTNISAAFAATDTWYKTDGNPAKPSAYAVIGAPLYDSSGVTIAVDSNESSNGVRDMNNGWNAFLKDATNGANSAIRAKNFVGVHSSDNVILIHQSSAGAFSAVEVVEAGSFAVNFKLSSYLDYTWKMYTGIQNITYDFHTKITTAQYDDGSGLTDIPHAAGEAFTIRRMDSADIRNGSPVFETYIL